MNGNLTLVLDGNNPRVPWKPSTTMLTYRLTGTTEAPASNRSELLEYREATPTRQSSQRHGAPSAEDAPSLTCIFIPSG